MLGSTENSQLYPPLKTESRAPAATPENCEEATLLRLARLGGFLGEQARTQLVQQQYSWVLASCRHTLRNEADAADAAQEAALAMYRALPGFEGRSTLRTWLHRIVRNACISLIRKRQRHAMTEHIECLLEIHLQQCLSPATENSEVIAGVRQSLAALNDKSREVLQLRFFNDFSLEDISQTLGISLSAAKMRLYRAMEQFRQQHSTLVCPAIQ